MMKSMKQAEDIESLNTDTNSIKNIKICKNNNKNNLMLNEAFSYGIKLKQKFGLDMSNTILKNFVAGINRIWQEKYEKDIKEIKKNYQKELDFLYSQSQRQKLNKNQTQIINNINSNNFSANTSNNNINNNSDSNSIKNNIYFIKNIQNNNDYEKGCFWMIGRCQEEMNELDKNLLIDSK